MDPQRVLTKESNCPGMEQIEQHCMKHDSIWSTYRFCYWNVRNAHTCMYLNENDSTRIQLIQYTHQKFIEFYGFKKILFLRTFIARDSTGKVFFLSSP